MLRESNSSDDKQGIEGKAALGCVVLPAEERAGEEENKGRAWKRGLGDAAFVLREFNQRKRTCDSILESAWWPCAVFRQSYQ